MAAERWKSVNDESCKSVFIQKAMKTGYAFVL